MTAVIIGAAAPIMVVLWTARANSWEGAANKIRDQAGRQSSAMALRARSTARDQARSSQLAAQQNGLAKSTASQQRPLNNHPAVLDHRRRFALGMIETGNNDHEVGRAGEVSRYQIMPTVWKHYTRSRNYTNPAISTEVARQHWAALYGYFKRMTNREPSDFDLYVLWNTRYGYYARKGFNPARLNRVVRDRARRFVNLVERGKAEAAETSVSQQNPAFQPAS